MISPLVLLVLNLVVLSPKLQVTKYPVMTPFCCEGRGGDQERVMVREVAVMVKFWGGPLGAEWAKYES